MSQKDRYISHRKDLLKYISDILEKNEEFLDKNAKDVYGEVIELINDSIDYTRTLISKENYINQAMSFFLLHIFMPQSYSLYINLLSGNLLTCFTQLRLMIESLAKSFYADLKYSSNIFFGEKFKKLNKDLEEQRISIGRIIREVDDTLKIRKKGLFYLWKKLSKEWVHTEGIVRRVIDHVVKQKDTPPWALVLPLPYNKEDLQKINELGQYLLKFRKILKDMIKRIS